MRTIVGTFAVTAVLCLIATPVFRLIALRFGLVDHPDGHRKLHKDGTPVSGGIPVFLCALAGCLVALTIPNRWQAALGADPGFLVGLGLSALVVLIVGVIDDRFGLRGRQKLFGQIVACGVLIGFGLRIDAVTLFDGEPVQLHFMAIPFTMFWLLGAINAFNLLDGVDGLAASLGLIISVGLAVMAVLFQDGQHGAYAIIAVALAGSLTGFLVYNFPPARIFLGDAGSMLIGLVLGALAIRCSLKGAATAALVIPTAIWTIPILDVSMAILRRKLTGKSLYDTDRAHLHHCLMARGLKGPQLLLGVGLLCCLAAGGAVISLSFHNEYLAVAAALLVVMILVVTRSFGHTELAMLSRRLRGLARSLVSSQRGDDKGAGPVRAHLQGHREWDSLWETLTEFANDFDIDSIELNVSIPALGEEYHAQWSRKEPTANRPVWRTDIPILLNDSSAGRLRVAGPAGPGSVCSWMGELLNGLKPFEAQMLDLVRAEMESGAASPEPLVDEDGGAAEQLPTDVDAEAEVVAADGEPVRLRVG